MNTKRNVVVVLLATLLILGGGMTYLYLTGDSSGQVDASKIVSAAWSYSGDLRIKGRPVPESVTLEELIKLGFLAESDVSGFAGMEVSVNLHADPKRPKDVLLRARLQDGTELVTLADGTVQPAGKP
ncbi:MAG TPA: hypothetical protein VLD18_14185 [Verrucomicrobiae bacterium]|nr:hypothetical protein [Verrucomicrobiae bacterium]